LQHSSSQIYIQGFQLVTRYTKLLFWSLDFEWIMDVICCTKQARWMAKSKMVPAYKLEHTNKKLDRRLTSLLLLARFSLVHSSLLLRDLVHLPNVLVHSSVCIIDPSTWCFRFDSLSYSLASHASMIFLQNKALAAPSHACTLHVVW
jgi:hypothetical protein